MTCVFRRVKARSKTGQLWVNLKFRTQRCALVILNKLALRLTQVITTRRLCQRSAAQPPPATSRGDVPDLSRCETPAMSATAIESTVQALAEANELLAAHAAFILRVGSSQRQRREQLHALESPPNELLKFPYISTPQPSPPSEHSPLPSPAPERVIRPDLPPAKRARAARYSNYVPEEETIRNDYSQRYVDGGEVAPKLGHRGRA